MDISDYLLTSAQSDQQYSCCLFDYNTLNVFKHYKNGGSVPPKCMEVLGKDYILTGELAKPLLHLWLLNSQDVSKQVRLVLPEPANCLTVCPRNIYLAVGINCKTYVWHMPSGKLLAVQQKNYQPVSVIKFSSDGDFLLIGGQDGMLINFCLTDLVSFSSNFLSQNQIRKSEPLYIKNDHSMAIKDIHIGAFGKKARFASVSIDKSCRIYDLLSGELLCNLIFEDCLSSVLFDSWFGLLYVGTENGSIKQFNLKEPPATLTHHIDKTNSLSFIGHTNRIVCLALNSSETVLASGSLDCLVYTWDVKKQQILKKIRHNSPVTNVKFVISYRNFFAEIIKPQVFIKSLERNLDFTKDITVVQLQTEDLYTKSDDFELSNDQSKIDLLEENVKLRGANMELYNTAISLSRRIFLSDT